MSQQKIGAPPQGVCWVTGSLSARGVNQQPHVSKGASPAQPPEEVWMRSSLQNMKATLPLKKVNAHTADVRIMFTAEFNRVSYGSLW